MQHASFLPHAIFEATTSVDEKYCKRGGKYQEKIARECSNEQFDSGPLGIFYKSLRVNPGWRLTRRLGKIMKYIGNKFVGGFKKYLDVQFEPKGFTSFQKLIWGLSWSQS